MVIWKGMKNEKHEHWDVRINDGYINARFMSALLLG